MAAEVAAERERIERMGGGACRRAVATAAERNAGERTKRKGRNKSEMENGVPGERRGRIFFFFNG